MTEKKLEVENLIISFRTQGGKVQAVRKISFDLNKGETLAIVGESGSGKSVTSRAVMGILAPNAIIEGGEIIYDGKDLLCISEEEMHSIRGDKIAMIFQDPLSSLNPIMKIGKQITEAMLLKNKENRKESRKLFNHMLNVLSENILAAIGMEHKEEVSQLCKTFNAFNLCAIRMENSYNRALTAAEETVAVIGDLLFRLERKQKPNVKTEISLIIAQLNRVKDAFFTASADEKISSMSTNLKTFAKSNREFTTETITELKEIETLMKELIAQNKPNFFRIGYYMFKNPSADLSKMPVEEANALALKYLDENFMIRFIELEKKGIQASYQKSIENKQKVLDALQENIDYFSTQSLTHEESNKRCHALSTLVEKSIDKLAIVKDSAAYTFGSSLKHAISKYFFYKKNNPKEEMRFVRQSKKRDKLIARGKKVDWKVVPQVYVELEELRAAIVKILQRIQKNYRADLEKGVPDYDAKGIALIDFFKSKASEVVYRITSRVAREEAIKLMEEVGIAEARIRYNQYPFEFSGGMRQRIVIAIALAANPDILICDEPTTALDVTIQAQILELINKLKRERHLSVIFITHDLGVVANMADRIAVMYAGKIVEYGSAEDIFYTPRHPYTWALLSSMPDLDTNEKLDAIPGTPPNMIYPPEGDAFAARNKYALAIDYEQQPPMFQISPTHFAATWLLHPDAPKIEIPKVITDRIERMRKKGEQGGIKGGKQ